jgi:hypothetical protein
MQKDKQFRVAGNWALAKDNLQWVLQRRQGKSEQWAAVKFSRDKAHLTERMRQLGVPADDAEVLLAGLPDFFPEVPSSGNGAWHGDFSPDREAWVKKKKWYSWRVVAGSLTPNQFHCATVSDRDPNTGKSFYEEIEARNRKLLRDAGL